VVDVDKEVQSCSCIQYKLGAFILPGAGTGVPLPVASLSRWERGADGRLSSMYVACRVCDAIRISISITHKVKACGREQAKPMIDSERNRGEEPMTIFARSGPVRRKYLSKATR
jgi:hypothetical protein